MRRLGKWLGRGLMLVAGLVIAAWVFGPREPVDTEISFDASLLGDDLDVYLAQVEAQVDGITPGVNKRIIWAGEVGAKTPMVIVNLHGWSASSEEIRPVADNVAAALGANLFYARLRGHGRDGVALASVTAGDWIEDSAEAMAIARQLGGRIIVIGTSTGGTLAAEIAAHPELNTGLAGIVFLSPNFRINAAAAPLLTLPYARYYLPFVAGKSRSWQGESEAQNLYWTTSYPIEALLPMAALVRHAGGLNFAAIDLPGLFIFSMEDGTVDHQRTQEIIRNWGGTTTIVNPIINEPDKRGAHVIAGDIVSPSRTAEISQTIIDWAGALQ